MARMKLHLMKTPHKNSEELPYTADDLAVVMYDYLNSEEFDHLKKPEEEIHDT